MPFTRLCMHSENSWRRKRFSEISLESSEQFFKYMIIDIIDPIPPIGFSQPIPQSLTGTVVSGIGSCVLVRTDCWGRAMLVLISEVVVGGTHAAGESVFDLHLQHIDTDI